MEATAWCTRSWKRRASPTAVVAGPPLPGASASAADQRCQACRELSICCRCHVGVGVLGGRLVKCRPTCTEAPTII
eukprot:9498602-Pyramimonas_sp.AAC.1